MQNNIAILALLIIWGIQGMLQYYLKYIYMVFISNP